MVSKQTAQALNKEAEISWVLHRAASINLACQNGCVSQSCSSTLACPHTLHYLGGMVEKVGDGGGGGGGGCTYGKKTQLSKVQSHQN